MSRICRPDESLVAGVLVGGRSRRFGSPKALTPMPSGGTLVEHVVGVAQQVAAHVVLLGGAAELPRSLDPLRRLPDDPHGAGPAAGVAALLQYVADRAAQAGLVQDHWGLVLSCDLPRICPEALTSLVTSPRGDVDAVVFRTGDDHGKLEACCALYHPRLLPLVQRALIQDHGCLQHLLARVRLATAALPPEMSDTLRDIDTPQDAADYFARQLPPARFLVP